MVPVQEIPRLAFSDAMQSSYAAVLREHCEAHGCNHIRNEASSPNPSDEPTPINVARELYWHFPAHFFKVQGALLDSTIDALWRGSPFEKSPLDKLTLHVIDIGSGVGTATLAVADLVLRKQRQLIEAKHAPAAVEIRSIAVEPAATKLSVFTRLVEEFNRHSAIDLVRIVLPEAICERFPGQDCVDALEGSLEHNPHALLVIASNLMNWIGPPRPFWRNWADSVQRMLRARPSEEEEAFVDYVRSVARVINRVKPEVAFVLGVETKEESLGQRAHFVGRELARTFGEEATLLGPAPVQYVNPEGSARRRDRPNYTNRYYSFYVRTWDRDLRSQAHWLRVLDLSNLRLAWAKARHSMTLEEIGDEVERRLFDIDLEHRLGRLQEEVQCRGLDTACDLLYHTPKSPNEDRPKTWCRLDQQVVSIAGVMPLTDAINGLAHACSYGCRLAQARLSTEFLYEYWANAFRACRQGATSSLHAAYDGASHRDIRRFYNNVQQSLLLAQLERACPSTESRLSGLLAQVVSRRCHECDEGCGLPQGAPLSSCLANLYLRPVDELMPVSEHKSFFRYVDDMIVLWKDDQDREARLARLERSLASLRLELHPTKRRDMTKEEWQTFAKEDPELSNLAARCQRLMRGLYSVPHGLLAAYARDRKQALADLHYMLREIGVFASVAWLDRKLRQERGVRGRLARLLRFRRSILSWPRYESGLAESPDLLRQWGVAMRAMNQALFDEMASITANLVTILTGALDAMRDECDDYQRKRIRARARFASYRLGIFACPEAVPLLRRTLLQHPDACHITLLTKALANYGDTKGLLTATYRPNETVRASAASALGYTSSANASSRLWELLFRNEPWLVKVAASEALLRLLCGNPSVARDEVLEVKRERRLAALWQDERCVPPVRKNVALLLAATREEGCERLLMQRLQTSESQSVIDAIVYAFHGDLGELFSPYEPEQLRQFWTRRYPDLEDDPEYFGTYYGS